VSAAYNTNVEKPFLELANKVLALTSTSFSWWNFAICHIYMYYLLSLRLLSTIVVFIIDHWCIFNYFCLIYL
jgi:hypothetical protein